MRLFVADGDWSELSEGGPPTVRIAALDLTHARRARTRIRVAAGTDPVAVILDVAVAVADDFRSARLALGPGDGVRYAGTVDGLAGLLADIEAAGVADGVTLISPSGRPDVRELGHDVLARLASRRQARAS